MAINYYCIDWQKPRELKQQLTIASKKLENTAGNIREAVQDSNSFKRSSLKDLIERMNDILKIINDAKRTFDKAKKVSV